MVQTKEHMLTKRGMYFMGTTEKLTRSTNGQKLAPASQAPGKSVLILDAQLPKENVPACNKLVAKKIQVNRGPKMACPQKALYKVDKIPVPGRSLNIISYQ